jgi:hypothetical protein
VMCPLCVHLCTLVRERLRKRSVYCTSCVKLEGARHLCIRSPKFENIRSLSLKRAFSKFLDVK